jgi:hypothetical protein
MKLIIPKITKAIYHNMINAYKNKYTSKRFTLSHTRSLSKTKIGMQLMHLELL